MAKWKEPTIQVPVTDVDPRARMKEIRAEVKAFLKGDTLGLAHLGGLPSNMEDARRVIIATQDLLEIERDKHRKATLHICELVAILNGMSQNELDAMAIIGQRDHKIYQLQQLNARHEQEIATTRRETQNMRQQRNAVLTTMRLKRNMETPAPAFIPREEAPQSNRSPVTLKQLFRNMTMGRAR